MALIWQPHSATQAKIREAEDGNLNPANGRVFSGTHSQLLKDSRTLPVQSGDHCQVFLDNLKNHRVVVLTGATGSGKTTQVPRWAYSACGFGRLQADNLQIVVSQPRRLPSISVAGRVADEMDVKLGAEVGIKVRNYDRTDRKRTGMVFATDGMLVNLMKRDKRLSTYHVIIIDEAHERTANTDIVLTLLNGVLDLQPRLRIVIMSATLSTDIFQTFYGSKSVLQTIPGVTYEKEIFYLEDPEDPPPDYKFDVTAKIVDTILDIHLYHAVGTILVFVAGQRDIDEVIRETEKRFEEYEALDIGELQLRPLYGKMPQEEQHNVTRSLSPLSSNGRGRLCIVATNVAETSLTIPDVTYVIDSMMQIISVYNPRNLQHCLRQVPISKASAQQRAGRAGRTRPGKVFRMITEASYIQQTAPRLAPNLLLDEASTAMLTLYQLGRNPLTEKMIEPMAMESIMRGLEELYWLDFVDAQGTPTRLGVEAGTLSLAPHQSRLFIRSRNYGCSSEILTILAMLEATQDRTVWAPRPRERQKQSQFQHAQGVAQKKYTHPRGELFTLLEIYMDYRQNFGQNREVDHCNRNTLSLSTLRTADTARARLRGNMAAAGLPAVSLDPLDPYHDLKISQALCAGYFMRSAFRLRRGNPGDRRDRGDKFITLKGQVIAYSGSYFPAGEAGDFCIYESVLQRIDDRVVLVGATVVPPEFLIAAQPAHWDMSTFPSHGDIGRAKQAMTNVIQRMTKLDHRTIIGDWPAVHV